MGESGHWSALSGAPVVVVPGVLGGCDPICTIFPGAVSGRFGRCSCTRCPGGSECGGGVRRGGGEGANLRGLYQPLIACSKISRSCACVRASPSFAACTATGENSTGENAAHGSVLLQTLGTLR